MIRSNTDIKPLILTLDSRELYQSILRYLAMAAVQGYRWGVGVSQVEKPMVEILVD